MGTAAKIQLLGPGLLTLGGVDCGYISGPKLNLDADQVESLTAAWGKTPLDIFQIGTRAELVVVFDEIGMANYAAAMAGATRSTSGSDEVLTFGSYAGVRMTPVELVYTPRASAIATLFGLKAWRVVPVGQRMIDMGIEKTQGMEVTFRFLIDESKTNGENLFRWGVTSVSADTTAPTISSASPSSTAHDTGVSATAAKTITFNEQLNGQTVNVGTVMMVVASEAATVAAVPCTVSLDSTGLIVSITPVSALAATTKYEIIVTPGLKNASNIAYAGIKYDFTTT